MNEDTQTLSVDIPPTIENLKLPDPTLVEYYTDAENRIYWLTGEIDGSTIYITKAILKANAEDKGIPVNERKPIKIFIDSPGGLLLPTLSIIGAIGISKTPIWTINACTCYSAAAIILMSGHRRLAMPNTACLIHLGSGGTSGTYEQTESQMKQYKELVRIMKEFIMSHTKIDAKLLSKKMCPDWYINTDDIVNLGIVDEIISDIDTLL